MRNNVLLQYDQQNNITEMSNFHVKVVFYMSFNLQKFDVSWYSLKIEINVKYRPHNICLLARQS